MHETREYWPERRSVTIRLSLGTFGHSRTRSPMSQLLHMAIPKLAQSCCVICVQPLNSLRDFFEVNLDLSKPGSPVGMYQADETIVSRGHIAPPSTIHNCELTNTIVGEGSCLIVRSLMPHACI